MKPGSKHRARTGLNLSFFNKLWLSFLLAILLPTVIISYLYYTTFAKEWTAQVDQASKESLSSLANQVNQLMGSINVFSVQLSMADDLNEVLIHPDAGGMYKYKLIKENLNNHLASNNRLYSIYLYMPLSDRVLTTNEGMFNRSDFYDRSFLDRVLKNEPGLASMQLREIKDSTDSAPRGVFTLIQRIPPLNSYPLGLLIVNVKKEALAGSLEQHSEGNIAIMDADRNWVYRHFDKDLSMHYDSAALDSYVSDGDKPLVGIMGSEKYLIRTQKVDGTDLTLVRFDAYRNLEEKLQAKLWVIVRNDLFVLLAGLLVSYVLSMAIHHPWKKVVFGLAEYFKQASTGLKNDSAWVTHAVQSLIKENRSFRKTVSTNEAVIRDRFICDVLTRNYSPKLDLASKFRNMGIVFEFPAYLVIIASTDHPGADNSDSTAEYDDKLLLFSYINNKLRQSFPVAGTMLEKLNFGFILNVGENTLTQALRESLQQLCGEMNDWSQRQLNVSLQFTFGDTCDSLTQVCESYEQAKSIFTYKAVIHKTDIVFYPDLTGSHQWHYPLSVQKQLLHSLSCVQRDSGLMCVEELFQHYILNGKYPLNQLYEMIFLLTGAVKSRLLEEGLDLEAVGRHISASQIFACANNDELYSMMTQYVHSVFDALETLHEGKTNDQYIRKAAQYIEQNYKYNISVPDIAECLGLSTGYLSRHFKAEIGKSPLEFLTEYRINKSKEYLKNNRITLKEISESIGYVDVNSFIRYFKKYEGITPGKYRDSLRNS